MPPPARDSVFISYSRRDEAWLDRCLVFLKPFMRMGSLTVWNDRYIEVGGVWRREIDAGLQRAAVGLLLVSPDFLASDFIMDEELPALLDAAGRDLLKLVWVPVSASHWKHTPLEPYACAWNPGQPLDSLPEPERNAALVQITEHIAEAAAKYATAVAAPAEVTCREEREVAAIVRTKLAVGGPGDLHDVPALPPHFVPRTDDLGRLRHSLLQGGWGALGITGEPYRMGLHGQGGIGKSVLAAALARDEQVRLAFPGGVFWVTVGQSPDVPRLQAALLAEVGGESAPVTDAQVGRKLLSERFGGKSILLVLDDVWDHRHALPFDVLGPASRLLVTTRDSSVLTALGARPEAVGRLPEPAAVELLARWAGDRGGTLAEVAHDVARECGHVPLALALAGARVRDGVTWEVVLKALEQGRLEFLDHPYRSVFGSLRLSVDALAPDERQRYLELAVFPEDDNIPESAVLTLWRHTAGIDELSGKSLLARFGNKALLEPVETDGRREIALHDLQHDFLRISVDNLPGLHGELLAALGADLPATEGRTEWWRLSAGDRYAWTHLAAHLVAAGRAEELRDLLFDCRWLEAKLRALGMPAVLADFAVLPADDELSLLAGALRISSHVVSSTPGQLRSQLTGRLLGMDRPRIQRMLREAVTNATGPWLRPGTSSLTPPTGPLLRTLTGHDGWVRAVALTADGRRAVSGADDGTVRVWDVETGVEQHVLGPMEVVLAVAITRDGRRAVSGSDDGTLKVWNAETGGELCRLGAPGSGVGAVAITADGLRVISGTSNGRVSVWNVETGAEERSLVAHRDEVTALAVTDDGRRLVSGDAYTVKVWNLEKGEWEFTLASYDKVPAAALEFALAALGKAPVAVALTPDGRRAVSGARNAATLMVWNLETWMEERRLESGANFVDSLAITEDGRQVVVGVSDGSLKVWDLETGAERRTLTGHAGAVLAVAMTPDGRRTVSASTDGTLKVWDLETAEDRTPAYRGGSITAVAITADGRRAISGSLDGTLSEWNMETLGEERALARHANGVTALALTPDGRRALFGSANGELRVWTADTGAAEPVVAGYPIALDALAVTPDGRRAVCGYGQFTPSVWNLETGEEEWTLSDQVYGLRSLALSPDGRRAIAGLSDSTLRVWNLEKRTEEWTLAAHLGVVTALAVSPDGLHVVSGSTDSRLKVWNLETGVEERTLAGHESIITAVAVTPDGRHAISGSSFRDPTLKVWNLETGVATHTLVGHTGSIASVTVTGDGRHAVSRSYDGTLKVWDLERGCLLATFTSDGPLNCHAVAPDGVRLVAGDQFGRVHFLSLEGVPPE